MRYQLDHDLHLHSQLSLCSNDPAQTPEALLRYAQKNGLSTICLTDHYWDAAVPGAEHFDFYRRQDFDHVARSKPLPQAEGVRFLFGCETDLDQYGTLGIPPARFDDFDFIIIPTTHLHMGGFTLRGDETTEERAALWCSRLDRVLAMDLPFEKIGIAHLTCSLLSKDYRAVLNAIPDEAYRARFDKAAALGVGIELNFDALSQTPEQLEQELRPYRIAKAAGCRFYFGSDSHHPEDLLRAMENFRTIADALDLDESEKFRIAQN